jgi:tripartite-type tricarboxylate transporter receptor subunit TctC
MADMLAKAIRLPEMKEFFDRQAQTDQFMRGEEFRKRLDEEFKAIEPVAKASMPR